MNPIFAWTILPTIRLRNNDRGSKIIVDVFEDGALLPYNWRLFLLAVIYIDSCWEITKLIIDELNN